MNTLQMELVVAIKPLRCPRTFQTLPLLVLPCLTSPSFLIDKRHIYIFIL